MARSWWVVLGGGLALAGLLAVWGPWRAGEGASTVMLRTDDAQRLARGRQVYAAQCASCHGDHRQGQANWHEPGPDGRLPAPPHDETGHTWHHPDALLFRITKEGVARAVNLPDHASNMPAFGGTVSDDDIVAVLSWIRSQWPAQTQARHDGINRQARESPR